MTLARTARKAAPKRAPAKARRKAAVPLDDRRDRILAAALEEFASQGFRAASTNAIAEQAGVAKGLLFHHFGSKEELFTAVFEAAVAKTAEHIWKDMDTLPKDLMERLMALGMRKLRFFQAEPSAYRVFTVALAEAPETLRQTLMAKQAKVLGAAMPKLMADLDTASLRPDVSVAEAMETISLLMEGLERRITPTLSAVPDRGVSQLHQVSETISRHLERLKHGIYRSPSKN